MARRPWYTFDDFKAAVTDLQLADTLMRDAEQEFANALDLLKSEHPELPKYGLWHHTKMSQVFVNLECAEMDRAKARDAYLAVARYFPGRLGEAMGMEPAFITRHETDAG